MNPIYYIFPAICTFSITIYCLSKLINEAASIKATLSDSDIILYAVGAGLNFTIFILFFIRLTQTIN